MYFVLLLVLTSWAISSCTKDEKEGLGYDVEGEWRMLSYQENNEIGPVYTDEVFMMSFSNYNGKQGDSQWWYYSESGILGSDTSRGRYQMYNLDQWITMYWTEHGSIFTGGFDSIRYSVNFQNDSLFLECLADDGGNYRRIVAIRD